MDTDDLVQAVTDAAIKTRSLMSSLTEEQLSQLGMLAEHVAAGSPLASTMLEFVSAVLLYCDAHTVTATTEEPATTGDDHPSKWRF